MKKVSFVFSVAMFTMLSFGAIVYGQKSSKSGLNFDKETLLNLPSDADHLALEKIKAINSRMHRDFSTRFKDATDIRVHQVDNSQMITCYTEGGLNRILYNKKGRWQHTVRTYENDQLQESIRSHIDYTYPTYSIFGGVIEVSVANKTAYLVTIEDKKTWKRIRVVDGESDVYEEYRK